ncbi:multicopper oxidase domain-containing protein [Pannus brasiliensis CCIBt3594]|uniref:Copper-containing nitrite reductase n=1 Tax=Pannus brasiliensis CCIBt3594 TaxID=1427578 RepID=A0AAW9QG58_9CHRO
MTGEKSSPRSLDRRHFLQLSLATGLGIGATALAWQKLHRSNPTPSLPVSTEPATRDPADPLFFLRDFDYGTVKQENGKTIREFRVEATTSTLHLNKAVSFVSWNLNGRVPGPTFRATEGDRIRVIFYNRAGHAHSLHFHGVHESAMDGVKPVRNNSVFIYEFDALPYGVHVYHCHVSPISRHINKGLYGMFIIDPPSPRPPADEMVLIMAGYDTNEDRKNELYAFNGLPNYYMDHPISLQKDRLVRLYLLNMVEYDPALTFHLHANFFQVYPTGMTLTPAYTSDVITMGTAERHILEFAFSHAGKYMFHPHQDTIAEAGCMGIFNVLDNA